MHISKYTYTYIYICICLALAWAGSTGSDKKRWVGWLVSWLVGRTDGRTDGRTAGRVAARFRTAHIAGGWRANGGGLCSGLVSLPKEPPKPALQPGSSQPQLKIFPHQAQTKLATIRGGGQPQVMAGCSECAATKEPVFRHTGRGSHYLSRC